MKYITLIIGLLVVGCGKSEVEKLVGSYEAKIVGDWGRMVFQSDGTMVWEEQNRARSYGKWKIEGKEAILSNKDRSANTFNNFSSPF